MNSSLRSIPPSNSFCVGNLHALMSQWGGKKGREGEKEAVRACPVFFPLRGKGEKGEREGEGKGGERSKGLSF